MTHPKLEIVDIPPFRGVHYRALEVYLAKVYHLTRFNALKAAGASHGVYPEYHIGAEIPSHLQAAANQIQTGKHGCDLGLVLTVLCADHHIPAGRYVIDTHREEDPTEAYKRLLQRTLDPIHPDCVRFKEKHRNTPRFRKKAGIIDRSLVEWLKKEPSEEPSEEP